MTNDGGKGGGWASEGDSDKPQAIDTASGEGAEEGSHRKCAGTFVESETYWSERGQVLKNGRWESAEKRGCEEIKANNDVVSVVHAGR